MTADAGSSGHYGCDELSNQISLWQVAKAAQATVAGTGAQEFAYGQQRLLLGDCFEWLRQAEPASLSAAVSDPPYGLVEYDAKEQAKMRSGRGGIWRIPPSFDGAKRRPLPRFTVLTPDDRNRILTFFESWGRLLAPALRPGAHVILAGNPLVSPLVAVAMERAGFERRGEIVRLVRTFRGGDRPKGAESEFADVSSMPRACWEPWGLYRRPLSEPTLAANLRRWGTGGLRRISAETPFLDVIESGTAPDAERAIAPHPSLKPQAFLRQIVRAVLPTRQGIVFDGFAGSGSTLAACEASGVAGIGVELDPRYYQMAVTALPGLAQER